MYVAALHEVQFVNETHAVHPVGQFTHYIWIESGNVPIGQLDAKTHEPSK